MQEVEEDHDQINETKEQFYWQNAFKGTAKKLIVKVPKKQYKAYKKFLKKKGNKTITKENHNLNMQKDGIMWR